jgi:SAM-dependent methyltransferase
MEWFEDWFNSKYYHILYQNRDEKEAENFIQNLSQFFKKEDKIIDIACGAGRHTLFLSELGYHTTGIDLSQESIKSAKEKSNGKIPFEVWDMRKCYKKQGFDVVLNLFTSFGYFENEEDDIAAIKAMSDNLKEEGILIIDFLNSKKVIDNLVQKETKEMDGVTFNISRKVEENFIIKNIEVNHDEEKMSFQEKVKALTKDDFFKLLTFAGLTIINTFGNYNLNDFNQQTSDRLIIIAKKWN